MKLIIKIRDLIRWRIRTLCADLLEDISRVQQYNLSTFAMHQKAFPQFKGICMGKCVIAHDDASMDEYITDGENGFIRNLNGNIATISKSDILSVRNRVKATAAAQYARWLSDKEKIIPFVENTIKRPPTHIGGSLDFLRRGLYILEALKSRIN